jgi:hypothetical protein
MPVVKEFESRRIELLYLTSSRDDPVFNADLQYTKAEYIGEGNKAFARLNFLSADFVLATTPGLDVYQWKRSKTVRHYGHVVHGFGDMSLYEIFGSDYFDSVLLLGDYQYSDIRALEKLRSLPEKELVTVGFSYMDACVEKIKSLPKIESSFTVLVSPSWGKSSLLSRYGTKLLDPLVKTGWHLIVRPHPQSLIIDKKMMKDLAEKYKNNVNLEWDYEHENIFSLNKADIMISDFSSIIFEYIYLFNRPVLYVKQDMDLRPYDAYLLFNTTDELWQFKTLKHIGVELTENMFDDISQVIQAISGNTELKENREKSMAESWKHQGEAGKRIVDFIINKAEIWS